MGIETEIKLRVGDIGDFRVRLKGLGAMVFEPRHFEDNYVLDYPNQSLRSEKSLLRVRLVGSRGWLTYKGAPLPNDLFKIREEVECAVEEGSLALEILGKIGMKVWFRYQKYREEYSIGFGRDGETVLVSLDETPVGTFVELEGSEHLIREVAGSLGYEESDYLRESYYSLYLRWRGIQGTARAETAEMVFEPRVSEDHRKNE